MEENFEKKLKDIFDNPPHTNADKEVWGNIVNGLEEQTPTIPSQSFNNWIYPIASILLLSLVGIIGYLLGQNKNLKEQLQQSVSSPSLQQEEIIEKRITIVYDTIYKNIEVNAPVQKSLITSSKQVKRNSSYTSPIPNNNIFTNPSLNYSSPLSSERIAQEWNKNRITIPNQINTSLNQPIEKEGTIGTRFTENLVNTNSVVPTTASLNILDLQLLYSNELKNLPLISYVTIDKQKQKKWWQRKWETHKPKSIAIGAHFGLGHDFSLNLEESGQANYIYGITTEIGFGKNWSMMIKGNYRTQNLSAEEEDDHSINFTDAGFPVLPPQDINDELYEVKWNASYLEIPIGFKYAFRSKNKLQPFLAFGITSMKNLKSKLDFEYKTPNDDEYSIISESILPKEFFLENVWGNIGLQYRITPKWNVFLEGGYTWNLNKNINSSLQDNQLINGQFGWTYQF